MPLALPKITVCTLVLAAFAATSALASITPITDPGAGTGSERCLSSGAGNGGTCALQGTYGGLESMIQLFADAYGLNLTRIDDSSDQIWTAAAGAGVFGLARSASRNFNLGELPGYSGGTYQQVLGVIGSASSPVVYLPNASVPAAGTGQNAHNDLQTSSTYSSTTGLPTFTSISAGTFRFAIQCGDPTSCGGTLGQTWSSVPTDNTSDGGKDHLVTWQLTGAAIPTGDVWYIGGFENGTDFDFNDYAFIFQNVTPSSDTPTPEPRSFLLFGGGFVCLLGLLRFRSEKLQNWG